MGMPVKLSDELVNLARQEAQGAERSITGQIEHWAKLGRSLETALRHEDALALKGAEGNLRSAFVGASTRLAVFAVLQQVAATVDRSELARTLTQGRVVYQGDPTGSGSVVRIEPDGRRTAGRFDKRRFVAVRHTRNRDHR